MSINFILFNFFTLLAVGHSIFYKEDVAFAEDHYEETHGKIIFSVMAFRHADRFAMSDFPTNPHSKYMIEAGQGKLTNQGKRRAFKLGLWTRRRYRNLIKDKPYHSELFNVISTTSERAVNTAQLFMAAFYPPTSDEEEIWHKNLEWQPIPIFTDDRVLKMGYNCPRFNLEMERVKLSPQMKEYYRQREKSFQYIQENRKREIPKNDPVCAVQKASAFYDTLYVQDQLNLKHSPWISKIYPKGKTEVQSMFFRLHTYNHEMKRLKGGTLLKHIINELDSKRNDPEQEKIFQFYSGHDSNIIALLNTMGIWDHSLLPPYCAALMFELRKLKDDYIVTIMYRQSNDVSLLKLEIPNCQDPCTLDGFIAATKSVISDDLVNECKYFTPDYNTVLF